VYSSDLMTSPPKPWEKNDGGGSIQPDQPPIIPERPSSSSLVNPRFNNTAGTYGTYNSGVGGYGSSSYGMGGYGSGGYGSSMGGYGSTTGGYGSGGYGSTLGSYGTPYGGIGGYGSSYGMGGYGSSMGGYPRGPFARPIDPNNPNQELPLGAQVEQSTQHAFFILDQIVQSFAGFSHMLESTFHATHSSFMAMVGVAEQFGNLRSYFSQIFSLVHIYNAVRGLIYRVAGVRVVEDLTPASFESFKPSGPKKSSRPLWFFISLLLGLPYCVSLLLRRIQHTRSLNPPPPSPKDTQFARALYDYNPTQPTDLAFRKGQIIAVLSRLEEGQRESGWWRGRVQDGRVGLFPAGYVEIIEKKEGTKDAEKKSSAMDTGSTDIIDFQGY